MNFRIQVWINDIQCHLLLDSYSNLLLMNQLETKVIELSIDKKVQWIPQSHQIIGFQIDNIICYGDNEDLMQLRKVLGTVVTYTKILKMFRFIQVIGYGTYSQVCELKCRFTGETYAVKCLKKKDKEVHDEIKIWRKLNHKNIARFYELYESSNSIYIVTEKLDHLRNDYDHEEIKLIIKDILDAIQYLHNQGIIHRDIKLENIMISENNQTKLIDFGLSCDITDFNAKQILCGTPGHIAPEIFNQSTYDQKCDLFSLGVVMYQLYTNKQLFKSDSVEEILKMNKKFSLSKLSLINIPDNGYQFLKGLLNPIPAERFSIKQAYNHWYLKSLQNEQIKIPKSNKPKFKTYIQQHSKSLTYLNIGTYSKTTITSIKQLDTTK